jgi:hypothetical protein
MQPERQPMSTSGQKRTSDCRPRRTAFYSFRNRVRIPKVVLVCLPERSGIGWRHLLDLVTKRDQLTSYVV